MTLILLLKPEQAGGGARWRGRYAGEIGFEFPGEGDEGFDGALDGAAEPAFPGRLCRAFGSLFPQPLEVFLKDVDGHQGVVGGEQLVEADQVLLSFDVVAVPEQQPARAFDHLAGWFVVGQAVGFVDADPVDHLAAELGDHVEEVEDDAGRRLGVGALGADLGLVGTVHIHGHGLDAVAPGAAQQFEERADILAPAAAPDPQNLLDRGIDDDGGVAMTLVNGELIHGQDGDAAQINGAERIHQVSLVDRLHGIPAQAEERRDMLDRKHLAQPRHALGQTPGDAGISIQPG